MTAFINRTKELQTLERLCKEKKPKLILLYGRRRVGKTALLLEFAKQHKALYIVARQESATDQLRKMSQDIALFFQDPVLQATPFQNYDGLFQYLLQKDIPVLLDEFPYLVETTPALPSILQEYWDTQFSKRSSFIILCGSSITMMESLLGYQSPLYGRRTEQILLEPLSFQDARLFLPKWPSERQLMSYAVLGGTPAYLQEFDQQESLEKNIIHKVLQKNTFLSQDTLFVLRQELNEPRWYFSIIASIAKGNTQMGTIINDTGLAKGVVSKYLAVLQQLHLVGRQVPVTEKHPEKSRKGIYLLKDNYFRFWFRFVFEHLNYVEQQKPELLWKEKILPQLSAFVGGVFEEIALSWAQRQFPDMLLGRWWDKDKEIDIVGISPQEAIFGEVKWKKLQKKEVLQILGELKEKSAFVPLAGKKKRFFIVGKEIPIKEQLRKQGLLVYDLHDICRKP
ncbi:ATP-binding protein [Candidatus Woesearchaeota archaeon]|nr:ATP-binding protein [Candidatus Woesearchaeota archaeon]